MARNKGIDIPIRARDEYSREVKQAQDALRKFVATHERAMKSGSQTQVMSAFAQVAQRQAKATADFVAKQKEAARVAHETAAAVRQQVIDTGAQQRRRMQEAFSAATTKKAAVATEQATEALRKESQAAGQVGTELKKAEATVLRATRAQRNLAVETQRAAKELREQQAAAAAGQGGDFADNLAGEWGTRQGRGFLGLRPYEMTNLSYQINDVVSGLAMGQAPMQVFAQQAGQIIQIFPKAMTAIIRFLPVIGLLGAAITPFIAIMRDMERQAESLDQFTQQLALSADGARYNAETFTQMAEVLRDLGVSIEDARASISTLFRAGVAQEDFQKVILHARTLASITGDDLPTAVEKMAAAYAGGVEEVRELDEELNFLTASQLEAMYQTDDTSEALSVLEDRLSDARGEVESTDSATDDLKDAWDELKQAFQDSGFFDWIKNELDLLKNFLANTAREIAWIVNLVSRGMRIIGGGGEAGAANVPSGPLPTDREAIDAEIDQIEARIAAIPPLDLVGDSGQVEDLTAELDGLRDRLESLRKFRGNFEDILGWEPRTPDTAPPDQTEAQLKEDVDEAAEEAKKAAEERLEAEKKLTEQIGDQLYMLGEQERLSKLSAREQFIEGELAKALNAAREKGLHVSREELEMIEASAAATYDALEAERERNREANKKPKKEKDPVKEEQKRLEKELNDLLEWRVQLLETIEHYRESGDTAMADSLSPQLQEVNGLLISAIDNLRQFWSQFNSPEAQAALAKLANIENSLKKAEEQAVVSGEEINNMLARGITDAFEQFVRATVEGENALKAFGRAFMQMAAEFLIEIGRMIMMQAILNALMGGPTANPGGGVGGGIADGINGLFRHDGGPITKFGGTRKPIPIGDLLESLPRFHNGGLPGLKNNEVLSVTEVGEEVITADDPRHTLNGGRGASPQVNLKNVNVFDASDMLDVALSDAAGQQVFMNFIGRNRNKIAGMLGR